MAEKRDYYDVLGVSKNSSAKEIKSAFKKLAKQYHPDISKEEDAENKFKEIQEAYSVLSDDSKKQQYDQFGHAAFDQNSGGGGGGFGDFDFSDIFSEMFGGGFGGQSRRRDPNGPRSGRDMEISIRLTFKEAVFGVEKTFSIKREQSCRTCNGVGGKNASDVATCSTCGGQGKVQRQQQTFMGMAVTEAICPSCQGKGKQIKNPCHTCKGSGRSVYSDEVKVSIPSGVENGSYMKVPQKGEGGHKGGSAGDLLLNISVSEDNFFKRDGLDIRVEIPISYAQATLGATIDVPTISGEVSLKIPAGSQSGTLLKIKGQGVKGHSNYFSGKSTGDQYVKINIKVPKKISDKEKKIIEQLSDYDDKHTDQDNFFSKIKSFFS